MNGQCPLFAYYWLHVCRILENMVSNVKKLETPTLPPDRRAISQLRRQQSRSPTSTIFLTKVREPPNVTKANSIPYNGKNEFNFVAPSSSLTCIAFQRLHCILTRWGICLWWWRLQIDLWFIQLYLMLIVLTACSFLESHNFDWHFAVTCTVSRVLCSVKQVHLVKATWYRRPMLCCRQFSVLSIKTGDTIVFIENSLIPLATFCKHVTQISRKTSILLPVHLPSCLSVWYQHPLREAHLRGGCNPLASGSGPLARQNFRRSTPGFANLGAEKSMKIKML